MKLTTNGSDANLYAAMSLTQGHTSECLVACGCYVSGDSGSLQSWSTSALEIGSGPAGIISLEDPRITSFTFNIQSPYLISLKVQCQMTTYANMKMSAWNIYISSSSTTRL